MNLTCFSIGKSHFFSSHAEMPPPKGSPFSTSFNSYDQRRKLIRWFFDQKIWHVGCILGNFVYKKYPHNSHLSFFLATFWKNPLYVTSLFSGGWMPHCWDRQWSLVLSWRRCHLSTPTSSAMWQPTLCHVKNTLWFFRPNLGMFISRNFKRWMENNTYYMLSYVYMKTTIGDATDQKIDSKSHQFL